MTLERKKLSIFYFIEKISAFLPELIGGSADLSGSNNTKTNNSKIINSKNFRHYSSG